MRHLKKIVWILVFPLFPIVVLMDQFLSEYNPTIKQSVVAVWTVWKTEVGL